MFGNIWLNCDSLTMKSAAPFSAADERGASDVRERAAADAVAANRPIRRLRKGFTPWKGLGNTPRP
ncbi:hypothetical protein GCM10011583_60220 [Streptomyces camponoticapitis]|uniref:Uncharacterized protein n=1 Tax=Streptomyces camponoticapitis TaxID=1616125 RepID=A0ABQ2ESP4_9ACTN|nr:hypothetical protein GCM10011583_60220 [Streptomyces camponoticapitis]